MRQKKAVAIFLSAFFLVCAADAEKRRHTFELVKGEFLLDGRPFQIISGEMHPARIPPEYWRHRILMARAMGCNTVAAYVFWNFHETAEGVFDFTTEERDIGRFLSLAAEAGMWVLLRPGPYVCAEWDFGGIPPYLLRHPDLKVRCRDPRYMAAAERYLAKLAEVVRPFQVSRGGPILMLQIENEYGSYGNDREYLLRLRDAWRRNGIGIPFFTADGPTPYMLEAGTIPGAAVGLDSGSSDKDFELAARICPGAPVFSSETYPGWLTHWGEKWARPGQGDLLREVKFLLDGRRSFNLYVVHGGTNFGFTAGANSGGKGYEPDVTSYDYDAPVDEQGRPTAKFHALRKLIAEHLPRGKKPPPIPAPVAAMEIGEIKVAPWASIWTRLPAPVLLVQPVPMEALGQTQGLILYRTRLVGLKGGRLAITELHDYALVFVDGKYIGKLDRREAEMAIDLPPAGTALPVLDILVEAMGRINFGQHLIDRKGITERVTLNGMTLMNWEAYSLPLDGPFIAALSGGETVERDRPGIFFKGKFRLTGTADTFFDMSAWSKGVVWVNGRNLGRYWEIGPQLRLYCPASWLKQGENEIVVFDLHRTEPAPLRGTPVLE